MLNEYINNNSAMKLFAHHAWVLAHKVWCVNAFMSGAPSYEIKDELRMQRRMRSIRFYKYEG